MPTITLSRRSLWMGILMFLAFALEVGFLAVDLVPARGSSETDVSDAHLATLLFAFPASVLAAAILLTLYHFKVQSDLERHIADRQREAEARETIAMLAHRHLNADGLEQFVSQVPLLLTDRLRVGCVELKLLPNGDRPEVIASHRVASRVTTRTDVVPIPSEGVAIGHLHVAHALDGATPWLRDTLVVISSFLAAAIERMRNEEEMRRGRDAALESARLKSEFLATMSHEIRTPLHGVLGMNALLLDTGLTPEQREYAETVGRSSQHLLTLLNDILDLSKIEADRLELDEVELDLERTVREAVSFLAEPAQQKGLELACYLHSGLPRSVRGDPGRLRQVLLNLVGNAVKFTDRGRVEVRVSTAPQTSPDSTLVRFEIVDTGPGVSAAVQARLFQPFTQADSSTTRRHGGSGLGLAISKRLAALMGGEIGVESEPGRGSRFWFTARVGVRSSQARMTSTRISQVRVGPAKGTRSTRRPDVTELEPLVASLTEEPHLHVLIAEDNPVNQRLAVRMLEKLGYRADVVNNGEEAIEAVRSREYGCVLMDCQMPGVDGYEATARIRALEGGGRRIPIVAVTASAMQGDRERCLAVGMDDYIAKPVRIEVLRAALEPHLGVGEGWGRAAREPLTARTA